jgi:hypothetical protein
MRTYHLTWIIFYLFSFPYLGENLYSTQERTALLSYNMNEQTMGSNYNSTEVEDKMKRLCDDEYHRNRVIEV